VLGSTTLGFLIIELEPNDSILEFVSTYKKALYETMYIKRAMVAIKIFIQSASG
jgi:hypothetical protein